MPIRDLLKNRDILTRDLAGDERIVAQDFVARRVRVLIDANPRLADPKAPGDIAAAATPGVATSLIAELPKVRKSQVLDVPRIETELPDALDRMLLVGAFERVDQDESLVRCDQPRPDIAHADVIEIVEDCEWRQVLQREVVRLPAEGGR